MTVDHLPAWTVPVVAGTRLCWFDGERNVTIPVTNCTPIYTRADRLDMNDWGFIATLPSENGASVCLVWDPENSRHYPDEPPLVMFVDVEHPEYGYPIQAAIIDDAIVYDPSCLGGECPGCEHGFGAWMAHVVTPADVLRELARVGSLPIRTPNTVGRSR